MTDTFFEIPFLLSCEHGNPAEIRQENLKFEFPALGFLVHKIKEWYL